MSDSIQFILVESFVRGLATPIAHAPTRERRDRNGTLPMDHGMIDPFFEWTGTGRPWKACFKCKTQRQRESLHIKIY